jgi:hypothetical protein
MNTKLLVKIAATSGAFVLVGGISVAALARSGAGSSTPPRLPVVSTPEVENDATGAPEPQETESPEASEQGENENDQNEADDDQGQNEDSNEDSDDQGENENANDQGENNDDQGENNDDQGENEAEDD